MINDAGKVICDSCKDMIQLVFFSNRSMHICPSCLHEVREKLAKIPFKFSYIFECEDSERPHKAMIEDWELGVLYLKEADRLGSEEKAAESVRNNYFKVMCAPERDTRFFMGTTFPYNSWVVIGVFWPPQVSQIDLGF